MSDYREFWIENGSFIYGCTDKKENLNGWRAGGEGPWHVIEHRALDVCKARIQELETFKKEALEIIKESVGTSVEYISYYEDHVREFLRKHGVKE
jgi:hypothetical protein